MQEILKLLHRIAQFMNSALALRVSCYCSFHELGNSAAQFMNWTISQIGCNIYIYTIKIILLSMFNSTDERTDYMGEKEGKTE